MTRIATALTEIDELEKDTVQFQFASALGSATISSIVSVVSEVVVGYDATPSSIFNGAAAAVGTNVNQPVKGTTAGNLYNLRCTILDSTGRQLVAAGYLPVVRL